MAYATVEEFVAKVTAVEARALAASGASYDATRIGAVLTDVSAEIDTYLAARYAVPVSPAVRALTVAAIALAREALDLQGRDFVKAEAARIRAWLRDVSAGKASVGADESGAEPSTSSDTVQFTAPARRLSRECDW